MAETCFCLGGGLLLLQLPLLRRLSQLLGIGLVPRYPTLRYHPSEGEVGSRWGLGVGGSRKVPVMAVVVLVIRWDRCGGGVAETSFCLGGGLLLLAHERLSGSSA